MFIPVQEVHFSDVVSAVEAYVAMYECPLLGATQSSGSHTSLQLDSGSDDLPPEYSVADKYPVSLQLGVDHNTHTISTTPSPGHQPSCG